MEADYDVIILGAGAAGLAAGLYTTRAMMKTLILESIGPGGQLLITVPNLVAYNNRITILFGSGLGIELHKILKLKTPVNPISGVRFPDQVQHLRFYTLKSLCKHLSSLNFEIELARGYDPVLSRIPGADRLLRNWCSLSFVIARKPAIA